MTKTARAAVLSLAAAVAIAAIAARLPGESQKKASRATKLDPAAVKAINEVGGDLEELAESHSGLMRSVGALEDLYVKLSEKGREVSALAAKARGTRGDAGKRLLQAAREMEKMQQGFNIQYLDLQKRIAHENRRFSMVSNTMKNKHDTAKNAVNNVR